MQKSFHFGRTCQRQWRDCMMLVSAWLHTAEIFEKGIAPGGEPVGNVQCPRKPLHSAHQGPHTQLAAARLTGQTDATPCDSCTHRRRLARRPAHERHGDPVSDPYGA